MVLVEISVIRGCVLGYEGVRERERNVGWTEKLCAKAIMTLRTEVESKNGQGKANG